MPGGTYNVSCNTDDSSLSLRFLAPLSFMPPSPFTDSKPVLVQLQREDYPSTPEYVASVFDHNMAFVAALEDWESRRAAIDAQHDLRQPSVPDDAVGNEVRPSHRLLCTLL
jgi:hypothetical protein